MVRLFFCRHSCSIIRRRVAQCWGLLWGLVLRRSLSRCLSVSVYWCAELQLERWSHLSYLWVGLLHFAMLRLFAKVQYLRVSPQFRSQKLLPRRALWCGEWRIKDLRNTLFAGGG